MNGTTPRDGIERDAESGNLLAQARRSCCGRSMLMPCSCGENSLTTAATRALDSGKPASIAPSLGMKAATGVQTSFAKRAQLLLSFGLIAGCIPTLMRKRSGQRILVAVSRKPAGDVVDERKPVK